MKLLRAPRGVRHLEREDEIAGGPGEGAFQSASVVLEEERRGPRSARPRGKRRGTRHGLRKAHAGSEGPFPRFAMGARRRVAVRSARRRRRGYSKYLSAPRPKPCRPSRCGSEEAVFLVKARTALASPRGGAREDRPPCSSSCLGMQAESMASTPVLNVSFLHSMFFDPALPWPSCGRPPRCTRRAPRRAPVRNRQRAHDTLAEGGSALRGSCHGFFQPHPVGSSRGRPGRARSPIVLPRGAFRRRSRGAVTSLPCPDSSGSAHNLESCRIPSPRTTSSRRVREQARRTPMMTRKSLRPTRRRFIRRPVRPSPRRT